MATELATRMEPQAIAEYVPSVVITLDQAKRNMQQLDQVKRELMRDGTDYDTIPGTPKPTLLKPGAERLLQFFGLGHKVSRIDAKEDWENGFFYYAYKVSVFKARPMPDGSVYEQVIAECEGSANSKEGRYKNQNAFTVVNTLQKMAIKRALVGATLQATGTSGFFSQDLEDDPELARTNGYSKPAPAPQPQQDSRMATEPQRKRLYALSKEAGMSDEELKAFVTATTGRTSSKELTKDDIQKCFNELELRIASATTANEGTVPPA